MQDAKEYKQEFDLEVRQMTKDHELFSGWNSLEFFVVPPARRLLFHAPYLCFGTRFSVRCYCVCRLCSVWRFAEMCGLLTLITVHSGFNE